ncbi:hypothetical protein [Microvirga pudoricolor]|uniref:hypothetical protein n=1 Tax=Microvirga pudoricolor TaxID=2778729 RepID=UPI00194DE739|nr:hypothetical protein [Microvirga pudoricolor]MBM6594446.1 hypothetical protein [Microvirga pudoricolor]
MAMDRNGQVDGKSDEARSPDLLIIPSQSDWIDGVSSGLERLEREAAAQSMETKAPMQQQGVAPMAVGVRVLWEGTDGNDVHVGDDSEDEIYGKGGDDSLVGGAGNDTLDGGEAGANGNTLEGGTGNDVYYIYSLKDVVVEYQDQGFDRLYTTVDFDVAKLGTNRYIEILEVNPVQTQGVTLSNASRLIGGVGADTLRFGATMNGGAGDDTYFVAGGSHQVIADSDGDDEVVVVDGGYGPFALGAGIEIELITLRGNSAAIGNELANHIVGEGGGNLLDGGIDSLADTLEGGGGSDTFRVRSSNDIVIEAVGATGNDTVEAYVDFALGADSHVETLKAMPSGTKTAFNLVGSKYTTLIQGSSGNDTLDSGPAGATDGFGNPIAVQIFAGMGDDEIHVRRQNAVAIDFEGGSDIVYAHVSASIGLGIETLEGYAGVDGLTLTGSFQAEVINGNERANTIVGSFGADTLSGRDGDDVYIIDSAEDIITEKAGEGFDTIRSSTHFTLAGGYEIEGLEAATNDDLTLVGNGLANTITGLDGKNTLDGGNDAVRDRLIGGKGDDSYIVRSEDEIAEKAGEGRDTATALGSFTLGKDVSVEVLQANAFVESLSLTGNNLANTIIGSAGADTLDGGGAAADSADSLVGGSGNDVYVVHRSTDVVSETGAGDADRIVTAVSFTIASNVETLEASAGAGDVTLTGNAAANTLIGAGGNDVLVGAGGADRLEGKSGDDTYELSDALAVIVEAVSGGTDTIRTSFSYALGADAEIEILQATGSASVHLTGNAYANTLIGNDATNVLDGGMGGAADVMRGHDGDDTYHVRHADDTVEEEAGQGMDTVVAYGHYTLGAGASLEILEAGAGAGSVSLVGNELANTIVGGNGDDSLDGGMSGDESDVLEGRDGDDTYRVHRTTDIVREEGTGHDVILTDVSLTIAANVEVLQASDLAGSVTLTGSGAAESLIGADGNDTLVGAGGADRLEGRGGNDTYRLADPAATIVEREGAGRDTVETAFSYALSVDAEIEVMRATGGDDVGLTGNRFANELIGNSGRNVLDGGASGAPDVMRGGLGDDIYHIRNANDVVIEESGEGNDKAIVYANFSLKHDESIEIVEADASTNGVTLEGNNLANTIIGAGGDDVLTGGGTAKDSADRLEGGDGNDIYIVRRVTDLVIEADGALSGSADRMVTSVDNTIAAHVEILQAVEGLADIALTGSDAGDTLIGNAGANILRGGGGADTMQGGAGDDIFYVDDEADIVEEATAGEFDTVILTEAISYTLTDSMLVEELRAKSGVAVQVLTGNSHANILIADAGNNTLIGGGGGDVLQGGVGDDTYHLASGDKVVEKSGEGTDTAVVAGSFALDDDASIEVLRAADGTTDGLSLTGSSFDNTIIGGSGNDVIDGRGGTDRLEGGLGDDTYVIRRNGSTIIEASGAGTDTAIVSVSYSLEGRDNVENLTAAPGAGSVRLTGNAGANRIIGNEGNNMISGGLGADTMAGGLGDDFYEVDEENDVVEEGLGGGNDTVVVVRNGMSFTLTEAMHVEQLWAGTGIEVRTLTGNSRANILIADLGDNTLDGGGGADRMQGGQGSDTYIVDDVRDDVIETNESGGDAGGIDTVVTSVSYILRDHVENLTAADGAGSLRLTGNRLANTITGGGGSDTLDGGAGNDGLADELRGGGGNDTYILRRAGDVIVEAGTDDADTVELAFDATAETYTLADRLEILRVTGEGDYALTGNASANTIIGGEGNDTIDGGLGADVLRGGAGDDVYVVDSSDVIDESAGGGTDTVRTSGSYTLGANVENLVATSATGAALTGNASANRVWGNAGADTIDGGAGADVMQGQGGDDTYIVDNAGDQVVEASGSGGVDTVVTSVSFALGAFLENLTASGSGAINLTGNSGANTLIGNDAANVIDGGAGADVMRGGAGDDTYVLDQAADQIIDSAGNDTALVSFSYTLGTDVENLTAVAGASSLGLAGNAFNNVITGTGGNDTLDGGAGADRLVGGDGNDTYVIDNAGDRIVDTGGVNTVLTSVSFRLDAYLNHLKGMGTGPLVPSGNSADNTISGGEGSDKIYGGLGRDRLAGGAGRDVFVLDTTVAKKKNANVDTITDFNVKDDSIHLENAIFKALGKKGTALKPAKFKKDAFHLGSKAHDADDRIIYNKKKGVLYYDADGAGGAAQVQIATLSKKLKMTHKDFFVV